MDKLFEKCKKLVLDNINSDITEEALTTLTTAILALYLTDGKIILEKMPNILKSLDIRIKPKTVVELANEISLSSNNEEKYKNALGAINTQMNISTKGPSISFEYHLFISLKNRKDIEVTNTIVHALTHLLRKLKPIIEPSKIVLYNGVSADYIDIKERKLIRKNLWFEDALVEYHAKRTTCNLIALLKEEHQTSSLRLYNKENYQYQDDKESPYKFFNTIIDTLCTDQSFQEKLNSTFQNPSLETYQALITCLNEPTNDNTFFSKYTELFNALGTSYTTNDSTNRKEIEQEITTMTQKFITRKSTKGL